jgi:hypothetical protein
MERLPQREIMMNILKFVFSDIFVTRCLGLVLGSMFIAATCWRDQTMAIIVSTTAIIAFLGSRLHHYYKEWLVDEQDKKEFKEWKILQATSDTCSTATSAMEKGDTSQEY